VTPVTTVALGPTGAPVVSRFEQAEMRELGVAVEIRSGNPLSIGFRSPSRDLSSGFDFDATMTSYVSAVGPTDEFGPQFPEDAKTGR
jgi:hypothetical protein